MENCICIKEHRAWDKNIDLTLSQNFKYEKHKIKFNKKTRRPKIVRPGQMGSWSYNIYDNDDKFIYSCDEEWFNEYFSNLSFIREEKINSIIY